MTRRAVRRESGAGTAVLAAITAVAAVVAIGAAAVGVWFVLTH